MSLVLQEFGKFSYDNMMMEMTQKINSAPISLGKCCMQTTSQTGKSNIIIAFIELYICNQQKPGPVFPKKD